MFSGIDQTQPKNICVIVRSEANPVDYESVTVTVTWVKTYSNMVSLYYFGMVYNSGIKLNADMYILVNRVIF